MAALGLLVVTISARTASVSTGQPPVAGVSAAANPQADLENSWRTRLESWTRAIDEHTPGSPDSAALFLAGWSEQDVKDAQNDFFELFAAYKREKARSGTTRVVNYKNIPLSLVEIQKLLGMKDDEAAAADVNPVLKLGAILHADVALLVVPFRRDRAGCSPFGTIAGRDGNRAGAGCFVIHWARARALLAAVKPNPAADPMVRLWYLAVITRLLEHQDFANADPIIQNSALLFPKDAALLFEHGYYHESFAAPGVQSVVHSIREGAPDAVTHLKEAEGLFADAIKADPFFAEARVHRGYVLSALGRHKEAAEELRLAAIAADSPRLRYFAELFLGSAEQAIGNRDAARDHYTNAATLFPLAQSPRLALGLLARQSADRTEALRAMRLVLSRPPAPDRNDPWWSYDVWQNRDADSLFSELYRKYAGGELP